MKVKSNGNIKKLVPVTTRNLSNTLADDRETKEGLYCREKGFWRELGMVHIVKRVLWIAGIAAGIYFIYIIITAVVYLYFQNPELEQGVKKEEMEQFMSDTISQDRAVLVQDRFESGLARVNLAENAEEYLDISYYAIEDGVSSEIFLASLITAANRGVQVRIIVDGVMNTFNRTIQDTALIFTEHPNIEFKYYNRPNLLKPWTWNHRYHDKLILVDDKLAMIGGRNIGDKYFAPEGYERASNDRDVVIVNTDEAHPEKSVIHEMKNYYEQVWRHDYSKAPHVTLSKRQQNKAEETKNRLMNRLVTAEHEQPEFFNLNLKWIDFSYPAREITFIHNPLEKKNSEPLVWQDLIVLMEHAEESIYIESPYIIPTTEMMQYVDREAITVPRLELHTNSLASTPNPLAYSGYLNYRDQLADSGIDLYEFQSVTESTHAKAFVFDERISAVGSFNVDPRSTFLNTEVMVVIDSEEFAEHLADNTAWIKQQSLQVGPDGNYLPSQTTEAADVSHTKQLIARILSKITKLIEHLL